MPLEPKEKVGLDAVVGSLPEDLAALLVVPIWKVSLESPDEPKVKVGLAASALAPNVETEEAARLDAPDANCEAEFTPADAAAVEAAGIAGEATIET